MSMFLGNLFELLNSKLKLDSGLESFASNVKDAFTNLFAKDVQEELDFGDAPKAAKSKVESLDDGQDNEDELLSERAHNVVRVTHTEATAFKGLPQDLASVIADIFKGAKPLVKPEADTLSTIPVENTVQDNTTAPAPAAPAPAAPAPAAPALAVPAAAAAIIPGGLGMGGGAEDSASSDSDSSYSADSDYSSYSSDSDTGDSTDSDTNYSIDSDSSTSVDAEDDTNGFNLLNLLNRFNPFNNGQKHTNTDDQQPLSGDDQEQHHSETNSSSGDTSSNSTDTSFKSTGADDESFETPASSTESDQSSFDLDEVDSSSMPQVQEGKTEHQDNASSVESDQSSFNLDEVNSSSMPQEQEQQKGEPKDNAGSSSSGSAIDLDAVDQSLMPQEQAQQKDEPRDNAGSSSSGSAIDLGAVDPSLMPQAQEDQKAEPTGDVDSSEKGQSSFDLDTLDPSSMPKAEESKAEMPEAASDKPLSLFDYVKLPSASAVTSLFGFGAKPTEEQPQREAEEKQRQLEEQQRLEREAEEQRQREADEKLRLQQEAEEKLRLQQEAEEKLRLQQEAEELRREEALEHERQEQLAMQEFLAQQSKPSVDLADISGHDLPDLAEGGSSSKELSGSTESTEPTSKPADLGSGSEQSEGEKSSDTSPLNGLTSKDMPTGSINPLEGITGEHIPKSVSLSNEGEQPTSTEDDLSTSSEQSHSGSSADTNPLLTMTLPTDSEVFNPLAGFKADEMPTASNPLAGFKAEDMPIPSNPLGGFKAEDMPKEQDPLASLSAEGMPKADSISPTVSESNDSINLGSVIELPADDSQAMPSFEEAVLQKTIEFLSQELVGEKIEVQGQLSELQALLGQASKVLEPSVFAKCQETLQELQGFMQSSESSASIDTKCLQETVCHLVSEISASIMSVRHLAETSSGQTKFAEVSVEDVTVPLGKQVESLGQNMLQLVVDKVSLKLLQDSASIEPKDSMATHALEPSDIVLSSDKANPLDYQGQQHAAKYHSALSGLANLNTKVTRAEIGKAYQCDEVLGKATAKLEQLLKTAQMLSDTSDSESSKATTQPTSDSELSAWIKLPGTMYKYAKVKIFGPDSIAEKPADSADKGEQVNPLSELTSSLVDDSIDPVKFKLAQLTHEAESHSSSSAWRAIAKQVKVVETAYDKLTELEATAKEAHEQFDHYREDTFLPAKEVYTQYLETQANLAHASDKVDVADEQSPQPVQDNHGGGWSLWSLFRGDNKASSSEATEKAPTAESTTHGNEHAEGPEFSLSDLSATALPQDTPVEATSIPTTNILDLGALDMPTGEHHQ